MPQLRPGRPLAGTTVQPWVQNSGVVRQRIRQLSARLSQRSAASSLPGTASLDTLQSFHQEEEQLVAQHIRPWRTADASCAVVAPYLLSTVGILWACEVVLCRAWACRTVL